MKCGAKTRNGGECRNAAGHRTEHPGFGRCSKHGGSTPNHNLRAVQNQVAQDLARMDVAPVTDPLAALAQLGGQVVAWRDRMADLVNDLTSVRYDGHGPVGEQTRAEVLLFERAIDQCRRVLVDIAKLNLDERMVRINEAQAELVDRALTAALQDLGLTAEQQEQAREATSRHLRAVS